MSWTLKIILLIVDLFCVVPDSFCLIIQSVLEPMNRISGVINSSNIFSLCVNHYTIIKQIYVMKYRVWHHVRSIIYSHVIVSRQSGLTMRWPDFFLFLLLHLIKFGTLYYPYVIKPAWATTSLFFVTWANARPQCFTTLSTQYCRKDLGSPSTFQYLSAVGLNGLSSFVRFNINKY